MPNPLPITEVTEFLIQDLEPEAAELLILRETQWIMSQVPDPKAGVFVPSESLWAS